MKKFNCKKKAYYFFLLVILVGFHLKGNAQTKYQIAIGESSDDRGRSIKHTSDNGFITVGSTYSFGAGDQDVYLIKTDSNGFIVWSKTFGGTLQDDGRGVCETSDGGFAVIGSTSSFGASANDLYLFKTDVNGTLVWSSRIGGNGDDYGFIIEETSDGGFIIVGHTDSYGGGGNDVYLVKTNSTGSVTWANTFGNGGDDRGFSVVQTNDGGYAVGGYTTSYGAGGADVLLIKTDASGNATWSKTFGGLYDDQAFSILQCSDHGYILTGFANRGNNTTVNNDIYLVRTDVNGNLTWGKTFGGLDDDEGNVVRQTSDGGFVVFGFESSTGFGSYDACLLKTNSSGNPVFTKSYGGSDDDLAISGYYLSNNTYALAGFTGSSGAGDFDVFVIKTGLNGSVGNNCNVQDISFPSNFTTSTGSGFVQGNGYASSSTATIALIPNDDFLFVCPPCNKPAIGHNVSYNAPGKATLSVTNEGGIYNWYDAATSGNLVFTGTTFTTDEIKGIKTYYVEHIVPNTVSCERTPVVASPISDELFFIPNIMTPNNDGKNDTFEILGLPESSKLQIYNRWGDRVFDSQFYNNLWSANNLSDGIYYYDLHLESGKSYKGWLQVLR